MKYKRVLVKLSGEALKGETDQILSADKLDKIAKSIKAMKDEGAEICIVCGAGNIWRGKLADSIGIEPAIADYMGMLGTVINGMAIESALEKIGLETRVMTAIHINQVAEPYIFKRAIKHLEDGKVVIFTGGTGNPFFTTDTAAALRAKEMKCQAILMAKNGVDGVYTADPRVDKKAKLIKNITYDELLNKNLKVMDSTAVSLLRDSDIIIRVFNMGDEETFKKVIAGDDIGTTISK
jgi:uridylate kinase